MVHESNEAERALKALGGVEARKEPAPKLGYQQAYVLYVDFLGFTDIVAKTRSTARNHERGLIDKIREALILPIPSIEESVPKGMGFDGADPALLYATTFSDFTIAVAQPNILGLLTLAALGTNVFVEALAAGFACRGGLALGDVYCESDASSGHRGIVFGPAFLDAYHLEHNHAQGARIVLSNTVADVVCNLPSDCPDEARRFLEHAIDQATDGPFCIKPFASLERTSASKRLEAIKLSLESMLERYTESPRVYRKLADLAREFNQAFEAFDDLQVDLQRQRR